MKTYEQSPSSIVCPAFGTATYWGQLMSSQFKSSLICLLANHPSRGTTLHDPRGEVMGFSAWRQGFSIVPPPGGRYPDRRPPPALRGNARRGISNVNTPVRLRWCGFYRSVKRRTLAAPASKKSSAPLKSAYLAAESDAKASKRGLWQGKSIVPSAWRRGGRLEYEKG